MSFNAMEWIRDGLAEELQKQGFSAPQPLEFGEGTAYWYKTDEVAYALRRQEEKSQVQLASTTLDEEGLPGDWRLLSSWLYEDATGERSDAESILNDFLEVVRGPKQTASVQQRRKRGKEDSSRNVDPVFFLNRLASLFPQLKDALHEEKIVYGQARPITFLKASVVPVVEELAAGKPDSADCQKLCALLDDMYKNGDLDLRSVVSHSLLNSLSDTAFENLRPKLSEELQRDLKYTRKLKDRVIKPEKPKRQRKKVEARLES